jgi:hypothetical protein
MKLIRMAMIKFSDNIGEKYLSEIYKMKGVLLQFHLFKFNNVENEITFPYFLTAQIGLEKLPEVQNNFIEVPDFARKVCEEAIENVANFISVSEGKQRRVCSTYPYIAFIPDTSTEKSLLEKTNGIFKPKKEFIDVSLSVTSRLQPILIEHLHDRTDGLQILAEVMNSGSSLGKYRELIRFFEKAFALQSNNLVIVVSDFFQGARADELSKSFSYTKEEIAEWFSVRNRAFHSVEKTEKVIHEREVTRFIPRMEQAAYDVLFNKLTWKSKSKARRQIYNPPFSTTSPFAKDEIPNQETDKPFVNTKVNAEIKLTPFVVDCYGSYERWGILNVEELKKCFPTWWIPPNLIPVDQITK